MNRDNEIRREIQSKFSDYRVPVPPEEWDRIEQSLNAAVTRRMIVRRRRYAASAAAVAILLLGGLLYIRPKNDVMTPLVSEPKPPVSRTESPHDRISETGAAEGAVVAATVTPHGLVQTSHDLKKQGKSTLAATVKLAKVGDISRLGRTLLVKTERSIAESGFSSVVKRIKNQPAGFLSGDAANEKFIKIGEEQADLINVGKSEQLDKEQIILAVNGRGGLTPFQQTVNSPMTLRTAQLADNNPQMAESRMMLTTNNTAGNVSEMEHNQPVSFGVTVSKSLFDDLSLETGILYTYLSSKVRNSSANFQVQETQHLHYLAIPLNVNYNLFSLKKLDIYASVGGMLEKDVYGEYRRKGEVTSTDLNISSEEEEITKISQRNPQISVNAGVGISYPVWQNLKLYGKIGGAYYFDANNQYKTIYSDSKIVMDLNVGLRYEFK